MLIKYLLILFTFPEVDSFFKVTSHEYYNTFAVQYFCSFQFRNILSEFEKKLDKKLMLSDHINQILKSPLKIITNFLKNPNKLTKPKIIKVKALQLCSPSE